MREQIENLSKQIEKIKEIAFKNKENLDYENQELSDSEIAKIKETQKLSKKMVGYSLASEYEKFKIATMIIRIIYVLLLFFIILGWLLVTKDYMDFKFGSYSVSEYEKEKNELERKNQELSDQIQSYLQKNNELSTKLRQKENENEILRSRFRSEQLSIILKQKEEETQNTPLSQEKNCITLTTISIHLRDIPDEQWEMIQLIPENTPVKVQTKQTHKNKIWYEVEISDRIGWISNIGIENFDDSCLDN